MIELDLKGVKNVLCLGAHSDDIEIGCGGTILELLQRRPTVKVVWVVFSGEGQRTTEAKESAHSFLRRAKSSEIIVHDFKGSFFPYNGEAIKQTFEELKRSCQPDLVFTHYREDRHQDHRLISDLTWNTWRDHVILEYEIPKYDGDLGRPNLFVPLKVSTCRKKVLALTQFFRTQADKQWFSEETFYGLMRLRGIECASPTKYAEGFYVRKLAMRI